MKSIRVFGLVVVAFCIASLAAPIGPASGPLAVSSTQDWVQLSVDAPYNSTHLSVLEDAINVTYNTDDAFQALNLIQLHESL